MTDFDLIECPNCGSIYTEDEENGFFYCWQCGEVWNADDDVPPPEDEGTPPLPDWGTRQTGDVDGIPF